MTMRLRVLRWPISVPTGRGASNAGTTTSTGKALRGGLPHRHHATVGQQRDVRVIGAATQSGEEMSCHVVGVRRQLDIIRHVLFFRVETLVLQKKDGVGPAQGGIDKQPACVVPVAAAYNRETRDP